MTRKKRRARSGLRTRKKRRVRSGLRTSKIKRPTSRQRATGLPDQSAIRRAVIHEVSVISGVKETNISSDDYLYEKLGMGDHLRRALATGFQIIARRTNSAAIVTRSECEQLYTVGAAIDLVFRKASP